MIWIWCSVVFSPNNPHQTHKQRGFRWPGASNPVSTAMLRNSTTKKIQSITPPMGITFIADFKNNLRTAPCAHAIKKKSTPPYTPVAVAKIQRLTQTHTIEVFKKWYNRGRGRRKKSTPLTRCIYKGLISQLNKKKSPQTHLTEQACSHFFLLLQLSCPNHHPHFT